MNDSARTRHDLIPTSAPRRERLLLRDGPLGVRAESRAARRRPRSRSGRGHGDSGVGQKVEPELLERRSGLLDVRLGPLDLALERLLVGVPQRVLERPEQRHRRHRERRQTRSPAPRRRSCPEDQRRRVAIAPALPSEPPTAPGVGTRRPARSGCSAACRPRARASRAGDGCGRRSRADRGRRCRPRSRAATPGG